MILKTLSQEHQLNKTRGSTMTEEENKSEESKMIEKFEIKLYDGRILRGNGRRIGVSGNQWIAGKEQNRWDEYELCKTSTGKYVLYHEFNTRWQGEESTDDFEIFQDEEQLLTFVRDEDNKLLFALLANAGIPIIINIL